MKKITCIDFETANPFWGSICSVGVAVIENGKITKTISSLVKPHPKYREFNRDNIRVHGIKPEMVKNAPEFDEIFKEIKPFIKGQMIAAHNTTFDVNCLRDVLTIYNIPIPSFKYICTCELSRAAWKGLENYKLKTVNTHLGHKFKHHDAGEDAVASANIILRAMQDYGCKDILSLAEKLNVKIGEVKEGEEYILSSEKARIKKSKQINIKEIKPENETLNPLHPLYKKEIVFTGDFKSGISRKQAMQLAVNCGAVLSSYVRPFTDYLVQGGNENFQKTLSSKMKKAKQLIEKDGKVRIISEEDFIRLVNF